MTKQQAAELRSAMLQAAVRALLGDQVTGFYIGLNAMLVAPELWRAILKDIEAEPRHGDLATAGRQALEQGAAALRPEYQRICADTPEASS